MSIHQAVLIVLAKGGDALKLGR